MMKAQPHVFIIFPIEQHAGKKKNNNEILRLTAIDSTLINNHHRKKNRMNSKILFPVRFGLLFLYLLVCFWDYLFFLVLSFVFCLNFDFDRVHSVCVSHPHRCVTTRRNLSSFLPSFCCALLFAHLSVDTKADPPPL